MQRPDKGSDNNVFFNDECIHGIRARANAGCGLWPFAFGPSLPRGMTSYAAARVAMPRMRYDGGRIMGVTPNVLVVSPSTSVARGILTAEAIDGTSNVWRGSAELIVSPCLQE